MGDIASLNINGVTYGLKDEVARSGGGGGSVLGYGQFGQFVNIRNSITLTKTSSYKTIFSLSGSGTLCGLGYGWLATGISSSTLNSGFRVSIDDHDLINISGTYTLDSMTYNTYNTLSVYSNFMIVNNNKYRPMYGWNVVCNEYNGKITLNTQHSFDSVTYNTGYILYRNLPYINSNYASTSMNLMSPVVFHNSLVIDYYWSCTQTPSKSALSLAVIGTTFQP